MAKNIYEIRVFVECERFIEVEADSEEEALELVQDEAAEVNSGEDFYACSIDVWDVTYGDEDE